MSNLVDHAQRELELLGEDEALTANLVACVAVFASFGHSGASAAIAAEHLSSLLRYKPLAPLGTTPDEWQDRTEESGTPMWQNRRSPSVFSKDGGRTWYDLDDKAAD